MRPALIAALICPACLLACDPDPEPSGPCASAATPVVRLGQGVGGAFVELVDGQEVTIAVAPQGGFGVAVVVETTGMRAADDALVVVQVRSELDGEEIGNFTLFQQPLFCTDTGGRLQGIVVGFDPTRFNSNDALVALDGQEVVLEMVIDGEDHSVQMRKPVTVRVGS